MINYYNTPCYLKIVDNKNIPKYLSSLEESFYDFDSNELIFQISTKKQLDSIIKIFKSQEKINLKIFKLPYIYDIKGILLSKIDLNSEFDTNNIFLKVGYTVDHYKLYQLSKEELRAFKLKKLKNLKNHKNKNDI